jgi:hypothetical protein
VYGWLADAVLLIHLAFILFVTLGGLLVLRWPRLAWVHVPAFVWGALIEFTGGVCPLTPLEVSLRQRAGEAGYAGGFIEHYVTSLIYLPMTRLTQIALGVIVLALNAVFYTLMIRRRRRPETSRSAPA